MGAGCLWRLTKALSGAQGLACRGQGGFRFRRHPVQPLFTVTASPQETWAAIGSRVGYTHIKDRGDRKLFDLPVLNNPAPPVTNGTSPQATLPLDSDDVVSLLRTIAAKLDDVIKEQRQLRAITADVWKP